MHNVVDGIVFHNKNKELTIVAPHGEKYTRERKKALTTSIRSLSVRCSSSDC